MGLPQIAVDWAERITSTWRQSVEAVIETGRLIAQAKDALPHGDFLAMIETALPFGARTAQMLMKVAADERLSNAKHVSHLPPSWGTLYELTKLDDDAFDEKLSDGTIRPEMERRDIVQVTKAKRRHEREIELGDKQRALPNKKYGVVLADPEWAFQPYSRETGMDRAADNHYPTSDLDVIKSRPVGDIAADDCVLFLWATAPMLPQALVVMAAWGFDYKTHCIWEKNIAGTGYWFRNRHELLLVGTRGKIPAPAPGEQEHSIIQSTRTAHSVKPAIFRKMIEGWFPNIPKIELNARKRRDGWDAWGLEAPEPIAAAMVPEVPHDPETGEIQEYPEERSGTAREAPSTLEGREASASDVGTQSAAPSPSIGEIELPPILHHTSSPPAIEFKVTGEPPIDEVRAGAQRIAAEYAKQTKFQVFIVNGRSYPIEESPSVDIGIPISANNGGASHEYLAASSALVENANDTGTGQTPGTGEWAAARTDPVPEVDLEITAALLRVELSKRDRNILKGIRLEDCDRDEQEFIARLRKDPAGATAAAVNRLRDLGAAQGLTTEQSL